jgi:succinyl-CoA synthetase beta subunit
MGNLAKLFVAKDCSLAEINPLVSPPPTDDHPDGQVLAIDAKFNFDDNGLFRHKDIQALHDPAEENPAELAPKKFGLSYIKLDGNIGCLVNGAGLAMATMDTIKHHGGDPANFLDVGGSASEEAVTEAFRIILRRGRQGHPRQHLRRHHGLRRHRQGHRQRRKNDDGSVGFKVPLVVRLEGNNVEAGRKILEAAAGDLPTLQAATT